MSSLKLCWLFRCAVGSNVPEAFASLVQQPYLNHCSPYPLFLFCWYGAINYVGVFFVEQWEQSLYLPILYEVGQTCLKISVWSLSLENMMKAGFKKNVDSNHRHNLIVDKPWTWAAVCSQILLSECLCLCLIPFCRGKISSLHLWETACSIIHSSWH